MKKSKNSKKIIAYILIAVVLTAFVVIRLATNKRFVTQRVYHYSKQQAVYVQGQIIQLKSVGADYFIAGTFEPNKETKMSTETPGKIESILVDIGNYVKKGQPVIQINNSLLKLQLQTVEIQIEGLESDVKRFSVLAVAGAIPGIQLEKAKLGLKSAEMQKANLQEQINKTTILAPFDSIVTAKLSEEGAFASPGTPLLQLTDIGMLKFTINVPETELSQFKQNNLYSIGADALPEVVLTGKAIMVGSKANQGSSFTVQFSVRNTPSLFIKAGMFGKLNLRNDRTEKRITIPASAILGTANNPQVYVAKNGKALLQDITITKRIQDVAIIESGLNEGDILITNGFINLFENANIVVNIQTPE